MSNSIDLSQFHEIFFEESIEGLEAMEDGLLKMDQGSSEPEVVNTVFRAAHSIKGSAGTFGFSPISDYTHVVETLLDEVRAGTRKITKDFVDVMLRSVDYVRHMINETKSGNAIKEDEVKERVAELHQFAASGVVSDGNSSGPVGALPKTESSNKKVDKNKDEPQAPVVSAAAEKTTLNRWLIAFKPHTEMMLTGNDPFRFLRELNELGETKAAVNTRELPSWEPFDPELCYLSWEIEVAGNISREDINEIFEWIEDDCELTIEQMSGDSTAMVDLSAATSENVDLNIEQALSKFSTESAKPTASGEKIDERNQEATSIRVNIDKVDNLVNLVGELVITQSILHQFTDADGELDQEKLQDGLVQLERNTRELQDETMRIRMLPIDSVFQRLPRLVRDLSNNLGKKVELKMHGNQTEVDKTVLEKIGDPLMHLIRNSLDHGLEMPEERIRKGKPETGLIDLKAYHEGGNIIIEVMDDGAGLNKQKILDKALERGLIKKDDEVSEAQIYRMIFAAGFTTATQVSDVSGRGVGMDVVNKNISDLGGSVDVSSVEGAGSIFTIKLPLTLAIVDSQLVRVGSEILIIPLLSIVKSVQIDDEHLGEIAGGSSVFRHEDEYIPVIRLSDSFSIITHEDDEDDHILVIVDVGQKVGLLVNEVVGLQQVVIKSLDSNYRQTDGIAGATILGDGKVAMIVDIGGLIRIEESRNRKNHEEGSAHVTH